MSVSSDSVLMIGWEYPPHNSGGLGVACEGLTQSLAQANTNVYFTLPYNHTQPIDHMNVIGCYDPTKAAQAHSAPFQAYSSTPTAQVTKKIAANELATLPQSEMEYRVNEYAHFVSHKTKTFQDNVSVIHAHDWMSFPAAMELQHQTGKPFIAHIHSTEYDRIPTGHGSPYIIKTEQAGVQRADKVIAVSHYTKKVLVERYQVDPSKIEVVHNGIFKLPRSVITPQPVFATGRPVIVFMGRLTMQKGANYFLQLANQVLAKISEALFVVAGDGDMYHELLFKTAYDKLSASVLFSGFVRGTQQARLLDRADVFVMPSLSEPFGLVALEAAQRHTPVIVSKTAGVAEVMPSALAVDFWDIEKMSQALVEILTNKRYSERITAGQLREVEKVTWQRAASRVKDIYRRAFFQS